MLALGKRVGLVLSGGGSHGAWQAGCLQALCEAGLAFHEALGFSIGSITGVGYMLGMQDVLAERWREMDRLRLLRFKPRLNAAWLSPVSLYEGGAVAEALAIVPDDEEARRRARCRLTVITHRLRDATLDYPAFSPAGAGAWDAPLRRRLAASCAVPFIFPPVELDGRLHIDGGVPGREMMRFDALAGCDAVVALMMTRPEEGGGLAAWLRRGPDQLGREMCLRQMDAGLGGLARGPKPPRIHRVIPSRVLDYDQMDFSSKSCVPALELGRLDGRAFAASLPRVPSAA